MKKILGVAICIFIFLNSGKAQKLDEYTASNGITYQVGDTIALGVGSAPDGAFEYIKSAFATTLLMALAEQQNFDTRLYYTYQGKQVVIRKIKLIDGKQTFSFTSDDGMYLVDIEGAIKNCELAYCQPDGFLTQQQFEKLVLLYQAYQNGDLTLEKFAALREEMIHPSVEK